MKQHYRSVYYNAGTDLTTTNIHGEVKVVSVPMLNPTLNATNAFWLAGGGIRPVNYNVAGTVPALQPNTVVLRGGIASASISLNPNRVNSCRVTLLIAYAKQQRQSALDTTPAAGSGGINEWLANLQTLQPYGWVWDPTDEADYSEYLHPPIVKKTFDLKPGDNFDINHRLKVKKIDCDSFLRYGPGCPWLFIIYGQINNSDGIAETIEHTHGYNLSFSVVDL